MLAPAARAASTSGRGRGLARARGLHRREIADDERGTLSPVGEVGLERTRSSLAATTNTRSRSATRSSMSAVSIAQRT